VVDEGNQYQVQVLRQSLPEEGGDRKGSVKGGFAGSTNPSRKLSPSGRSSKGVTTLPTSEWFSSWNSSRRWSSGELGGKSS
jgi:hypothetical protein